MSDLISRQATVERLCKVAEFMNEKRDGLGSPYVMAALFIQDNKEEFPSVTPKQSEWIPVSERLPEIFRLVNCTCHSLIDDREDWVVVTVYVPQPSNSPYSDWGNIPMLNNKECEVIAWMYREIPEPYKKGGE